MNRYYGGLDNDVPEGLGIMYLPNRITDMGWYSNGVLEGLGRIIFPNGDFYDGEFKDGRLEGEGFYYKRESDKWIFGNYKDGKCENVIERGEGVPLKEIGKKYFNKLVIFIVAWKAKRREGEPKIPKNIPNDVFFVPILEDDKMKKKGPRPRFVGLRRSVNPSSMLSTSLSDVDLKQLMNKAPSLRNLDGPPTLREIAGDIPLDKENKQGDISVAQSETKNELNNRIDNNILYNQDFLTVMAEQQKKNEDPSTFIDEESSGRKPRSVTQRPGTLKKDSKTPSVTFLNLKLIFLVENSYSTEIYLK